MNNRVITIASFEQLQRWWSFLAEGLESLNNYAKWNNTSSNFFRAVNTVLANTPGSGLVLCLVNSGGTPLGFVVLASIHNVFEGSRGTIYALYSNKQCPNAFAELIAEAERWAVSQGLPTLTFPCQRFSQAATRWFTQTLKFRKGHLTYEKALPLNTTTQEPIQECQYTSPLSSSGPQQLLLLADSE
jgi:hypothetical protein